MKSYQLGPKVTVTAAEAITANRFVAANGTHTVDIRGIGVALFDTASGDPITVQCSGIAVVEAGGTIAAGAYVSMDADGKAVSLTYDNVNDAIKICGVAMDAATDGTFLRVMLT
jgi:hypothetical protein